MTDPIRPQAGHPGYRPLPGRRAAHVAGHAEALKLSLEREPLRPVASARARPISAPSHTLHRYPSTDHAALRAAIGEVHGLDPARIVCGAGSDEIIAFLCQAYAGPGDEVISHRARLRHVPDLAPWPPAPPRYRVRERERRTDVDAILAACTEATRLVFIANPNNPTGTMIEPPRRRAAGRRAAGAARSWCSTAPMPISSRASTAMPRSSTTRDNVVMTRTFSKIYGLGGLRIGWGYGPAPSSTC